MDVKDSIRESTDTADLLANRHANDVASQESPVRPAEDAARITARRLKFVPGRKWAIGIWYAQVIASLGAMIAALVNIESIIVTGPLASFLGLALAFIARRLRSRSVLWFGLSAPIMWALCATLIVAFDLGPSEARLPISAVIIVCCALSAPLAVRALRAARHFPSRPTRVVWQYSLKSLLIVMTLLCLLLVAVRWAINDGSDKAAFVLFIAVMAALAGLAWWYFRRRISAGGETWVIDLAPEAAQIVKDLIRSGRFTDLSEIIAKSLPLLEQRLDVPPRDGEATACSDDRALGTPPIESHIVRN